MISKISLALLLLSSVAMANEKTLSVECLVADDAAGKILAVKKVDLLVGKPDSVIYTSASGLTYSVSMTTAGDEKVAPLEYLLFMNISRGEKLLAQSGSEIYLEKKEFNLMLSADPQAETMTCGYGN